MCLSLRRSFTHSGDSSPWRLNIGSSGAAYAFGGEDGVDLVGYQYAGEEYLDRVLQSIAAINDQSPPYIIHQVSAASAKAGPPPDLTAPKIVLVR